MQAGGGKRDKQPDWNKIDYHYQCSDDETHRQVKCPDCYWSGYDNIMARIFHLNDWHHWSSWDIGCWLEKYNL